MDLVCVFLVNTVYLRGLPKTVDVGWVWAVCRKRRDSHSHLYSIASPFVCQESALVLTVCRCSIIEIPRSLFAEDTGYHINLNLNLGLKRVILHTVR